MKDHFLDNWANLKSATQIAELFDNYEDVRKGYNFLPVEILNAVQTRSQVKAAREERGIDSGDAKKEDEVIIVSSDAEGRNFNTCTPGICSELALLGVTRENLINAQKIARRLNPYAEQAASQVQAVINQVYSLEKELLVKNREDKLGVAMNCIARKYSTPSELRERENFVNPRDVSNGTLDGTGRRG
ncbi:hypothetical protein TNCV_4841691 [Trichonephila clavipes]|uniref:Uncharacterized protein n=1 Tax=Trichonephila clavipes TaxID=2585209 RepID=A0A8X7BMI1_TRICX|nr:hypothetical protein TNCV_4841691 [Trichonephila clavipes]